MNRRIFAVVPARSGSKGVPDKNIRVLGGHPLLAWSVRAGILSRHVERVFVSTDSDEYARIAEGYGAEIPFLRPAAISGDGATDLEMAAHLLGWLQENDDLPHILVHLRPTTPLRSVEVVDAAIDALLAQPEATALRSVHPMAESAYKCLELEDGFLTTVFSRNPNLEDANKPRHTYPSTFVANGYVDVLRPDLICRKGQIHGDRVMGFVTETAIEVDGPGELELLEFFLARRPKLLSDLFGRGNV